MLHIARDDVWYGVFPGKPSTVPDYVPTVTLLAAFADRPSEDRKIAVGPTSEAEMVTGLAPADDHAAFVSVERIDGTDEIELRVRPIGADLQLGEGRAIPGTRGPARELLRLPTCATGASGSLVRLDAFVPRRVKIGDRTEIGYLTRLARITNDGACLERTYLVENRASFEPLVVVAGNEGVGFARDGGLRCMRVPTKP